MAKPNFTGIANVCVIVDNIIEAFFYYQRIFDAEPMECIPYWKNADYFTAAGFLEHTKQKEVSIGFLSLPGTCVTIEIMEYSGNDPYRKLMILRDNNGSGGCCASINVSNIEEAFNYIKDQPDTMMISESLSYRVYQTIVITPESFAAVHGVKKNNDDLADVLGHVRYFNFIDKYGLQWELEQRHIAG